MKDVTVFKREDPSAYYEVVERVADGGFARVFHVRRISDSKSFALKFMEPKDVSDYNNIKNEVSIMMMCNEG